ncbi:2OG-Fe(II) oxygenase [Foetidibacter luteolus]|uniref:2OG-Fe(II) oxygenase n=1 Tax=Foetidibacter luteolus TaxID=2608880 RepID=UPI00129BF864|nr:2OG-Fe(II) oxygenase [Foetidibacter luteolus]
MKSIEERIAAINWPQVTGMLHNTGYALVNGMLSHEECDALKACYSNDSLYRKTVNMQRHRFGAGEYRYFNYPLPLLVKTLREGIYPYLAPVANKWVDELNIPNRFPATLKELQALCERKEQTKPTVLILKYSQGGHNTLHQDLYGDVFFPMQVVILLSESEKDYQGGEFVLVQQTPRAQSKATVLKPGKGDMLVFTTNFRPVKGARGYYRVNMKHGVSEVLSGERYAAGIIFHDAQS